MDPIKVDSGFTIRDIEGHWLLDFAHWLLPFVMPLVLLGFARVFWWVAGAAWTEPGGAAFLCLVVGGTLGIVAAVGVEAKRE